MKLLLLLLSYISVKYNRCVTGISCCVSCDRHGSVVVDYILCVEDSIVDKNMLRDVLVNQSSVLMIGGFAVDPESIKVFGVFHVN